MIDLNKPTIYKNIHEGMIEFLTKLQGVNDNLIFVDQSLYPDLNILVQFEEPPKKVCDTIVIKNAVIEMANGVENLVDVIKKMFTEKFKVENLDEKLKFNYFFES